MLEDLCKQCFPIINSMPITEIEVRKLDTPDATYLSSISTGKERLSCELKYIIHSLSIQKITVIKNENITITVYVNSDINYSRTMIFSEQSFETYLEFDVLGCIVKCLGELTEDTTPAELNLPSGGTYNILDVFTNISKCMSEHKPKFIQINETCRTILNFILLTFRK
jgi:hypothetical protein